jgi:hypothetical protein
MKAHASIIRTLKLDSNGQKQKNRNLNSENSWVIFLLQLHVQYTYVQCTLPLLAAIVENSWE